MTEYHKKYERRIEYHKKYERRIAEANAILNDAYDVFQRAKEVHAEEIKEAIEEFEKAKGESKK